MPQLVGYDDGNINVKTYDWKSFFTPVNKKVAGLKKNHHFYFSAADTEKVFTREFSECESIAQPILRGAVPQSMPAVVTPAGLEKKTADIPVSRDPSVLFRPNEGHCVPTTCG